MDPQAPSSFNQNFNHEAFANHYNNGWLKYYFYTAIIFLFVSIANFIRTLKLAFYYLGNPIPKTEDGEYYNTILYGLSLLFLGWFGAFLSLGLFLQYQAIRLKSIAKQYSCLTILTLYTISQAGASILNVLACALTEPMGIISAILIGVIPFIVGMIFTFFASKILDLMLGPEVEPFKFDESA